MRLADSISLAEFEQGTVLLDERSGRYWELNPSGALILRALLGRDPGTEAGTEAGGGADLGSGPGSGGGTASAVAALTRQYQVDPDQALADVETLTAHLVRAGLAVE